MSLSSSTPVTTNTNGKLIVPKGLTPAASVQFGINTISLGPGQYNITHNAFRKYKECHIISKGQYWKSDKDDHIIKITGFCEVEGYHWEEVEGDAIIWSFQSAGDLIDNYTHLPLYDSPLYKAMNEDE